MTRQIDPHAPQGPTPKNPNRPPKTRRGLDDDDHQGGDVSLWAD